MNVSLLALIQRFLGWTPFRWHSVGSHPRVSGRISGVRKAKRAARKRRNRARAKR